MMGMKEIVSNIVISQVEKGGVKYVYYVVCGGFYVVFYLVKVFLEKEVKVLIVGLYNSGEFINNLLVVLGENVVVVVVFYKGNMLEIIKVVEIVCQYGVLVIGLIWIMDLLLVVYCDYVEMYMFGDGKDIVGEKMMKGLLSVVELFQQMEGYVYYDDFQDGVSKINCIVWCVCEQVVECVQVFVQEYKDDKVIYIVVSGVGYGVVYLQSICIFMEM